MARLEIVEKAEVEEGTENGSRTGQHHPPPAAAVPPPPPTSYPRLLLCILPHTRWCFFSCSHCQARPVRQLVILKMVVG